MDEAQQRKVKEGIINLSSNLQRMNERNVQDKFMRDEKERLREKQIEKQKNINRDTLKTNSKTAFKSLVSIAKQPIKSKTKKSYSNPTKGFSFNPPRF